MGQVPQESIFKKWALSSIQNIPLIWGTLATQCGFHHHIFHAPIYENKPAYLKLNKRKITITDAGDVQIPTLEEGHTNLSNTVSRIIQNGVLNFSFFLCSIYRAPVLMVSVCYNTGGLPFVIGGGNDQSYPNACGLIANHKNTPQYAIANTTLMNCVIPWKRIYDSLFVHTKSFKCGCDQHRCAFGRTTSQRRPRPFWISFPAAVGRL